MAVSGSYSSFRGLRAFQGIACGWGAHKRQALPPQGPWLFLFFFSAFRSFRPSSALFFPCFLLAGHCVIVLMLLTAWL
jgi:hypothetical protein